MKQSLLWHYALIFILFFYVNTFFGSSLHLPLVLLEQAATSIALFKGFYSHHTKKHILRRFLSPFFMQPCSCSAPVHPFSVTRSWSHPQEPTLESDFICRLKQQKTLHCYNLHYLEGMLLLPVLSSPLSGPLVFGETSVLKVITSSVLILCIVAVMLGSPTMRRLSSLIKKSWRCGSKAPGPPPQCPCWIEPRMKQCSASVSSEALRSSCTTPWTRLSVTRALTTLRGKIF